MTAFTATSAGVSIGRSRRIRAALIATWAIRILLSAQFALGGALKLLADPQLVMMFDQIGGGQGLRIFVGLCEVAGALGLLLPRLFRWAAAGLIALMIGAAVTNVVALQTSPVVPLILLALAAVVATSRTRKGDPR